MTDFVDDLTGGTTPQNAYDYSHEMSNSPFDQRHRFVASGEWKLPFGKDGWLMNNDSKTARLLGNCQFNGIVSLQTGTPFNVTAADNSQTGGSHAAYANCVSNPFANTTTNRLPISTQGDSDVFVNSSAFSTPTPCTFVSCKPALLHGPARR